MHVARCLTLMKRRPKDMEGVDVKNLKQIQYNLNKLLSLPWLVMAFLCCLNIRSFIEASFLKNFFHLKPSSYLCVRFGCIK